MKKIISLVVIFVMLITATVVPSFATENADINEKEYLFEHLLPETEFPLFYDEVYYHYVDENDPDSEIDWAIVYFESSPNAPSGTVRVVLDYVIVSGNLFMYYPVGWAVYDAELNEIISIDKIDATKYNGIEEGLKEAEVGNPFGDADLDGELTIFDATYIQRAVAGLHEFEEYDTIEGSPWGVTYDRPLNYISDIDSDGERTVLDATAIQMKLAQIEDTTPTE